MNIFATDPRPMVAAAHHCDVHVIKMILETAQLLSAAHVFCDGKQVAYKMTHQHHPCAVWIRESKSNYRWAFDLLVCLCAEYTYRFGKRHKTQDHLIALGHVPDNIPEDDLTAFAMAMPDEFRSNNPHKSYKRYLRAKLESWTLRDKPMRTSFTYREVPKHLLTVSTRIFPCIHLGVFHESAAKHQPARHGVVVPY